MAGDKGKNRVNPEIEGENPGAGNKPSVGNDLIEALSENELRLNREAGQKFNFIVSRLIHEDLDIDPKVIQVHRSGNLPEGYPGNNKPCNKLSVTIPGIMGGGDKLIVVYKSIDRIDDYSNFHVKVIEKTEKGESVVTSDKEYKEFGAVIGILDKISVILSRHHVGEKDRAEEILGFNYTNW